MGNLITLQMPVGRGRRWEGWAGRRRGGNDAGDVEIKPPPSPLHPLPSLCCHEHDNCRCWRIRYPPRAASESSTGQQIVSAAGGVTNTQRSSNLCTQSFAVKGWKGSENCLMGVVIYVVITDEEFTAGFGRVEKQNQRAAVHMLEQI